MAAKERSVEEIDSQEVPQETLFKGIVEKALKRACAQRGGLEMPVTRRGYEQVQEILKFDEQASIEANVNPRNFDVTLIIDGTKYRTANGNESAAMIQGARNFLELEGEMLFRFPEHMSFHAPKRESAVAA